MSRAFSLVYFTCFPCVLSPGLHDDDDEYHSMFCCMIFGMSSAHGSLPVAPVCPIAVNPIMRSGAGDLTRYVKDPVVLFLITGSSECELRVSCSNNLSINIVELLNVCY
jgi:hypothetical protein